MATPPPALTPKQLAHLRSLAHRLEPAVKVGKAGDTDGVRQEIDRILAKDELVKVRVGKTSSADPAAMAAEVGAALVQKLGHVVVLYRPAAEPRISLPT